MNDFQRIKATIEKKFQKKVNFGKLSNYFFRLIEV